MTSARVFTARVFALAALAPCLCCHATATADIDTKAGLQTTLTALGNAEARHDYAGWSRIAIEFLAPHAVIVTSNGRTATRQTAQQFFAAERKNLIATASAQGTIEHDFVLQYQRAGSGATALSELTMHTRENTSVGLATVDIVFSRQYVLQAQGGAWRVTRLSIKPTAVYLNGRPLGLLRPRTPQH